MVVDWGEMAKAPCYPAAVRNIRVAAHCAAAQLEFLRKGGLDISRMTCVGHSLGAHTCGLLASYVTFRLHKIIGIQFCFFENPIIIGSCFSFHSLFFFLQDSRFNFLSINQLTTKQFIDIKQQGTNGGFPS